MIRALSIFNQFLWGLRRWRGFRLPVGEQIDCWKDQTRVDSILINSGTKVNWATNTQTSYLLDPAKIGSDGTGSGTPMQLGRFAKRAVTWGSGYGRFNQWRTEIPLPLEGNRYWITGYPVPQYDKRCVISGPDGIVHELIQFDQDAPIRMAGLPQQALNRGSWKDGILIDGLATTAAGLPSHGYIWGPGSAEAPHVQSFQVQDYLDGDGTDDFRSLSIENLPRCGDWYYLDPNSLSFKLMVAKSGECAARAIALFERGARLIDRGQNTAFSTQAGTWADSTNIREFQINLNDLRRVY